LTSSLHIVVLEGHKHDYSDVPKIYQGSLIPQ
jgi:hypothetical protein